MIAAEYYSLIESFLDGAISAPGFESRYLAAFKNEQGGMDPRLFSILDSLFSAVDAFSPDCSDEEETAFEISERGLRRESMIARDKLRDYISTASQTRQ